MLLMFFLILMHIDVFTTMAALSALHYILGLKLPNLFCRAPSSVAKNARLVMSKYIFFIFTKSYTAIDK